MSGSVAEERIRAKVEAALRREFPDARIVHELNMSQGGIRLDLAAVRPDGITLVEIKSERDVLKRLRDQITAARRVTGDVRVYAAEKHRAGLVNAHRHHLADADGKTIYDWVEGKGGRRSGHTRPNPAYIADLFKCRVLIEKEEGFVWCEEMHPSWWHRWMFEYSADPRQLVELLWAEELRTLLAGAGLSASSRAARDETKRIAVEHMTGQQIRRGVCAALRARTFARADAAIGAAA